LKDQTALPLSPCEKFALFVGIKMDGCEQTNQVQAQSSSDDKKQIKAYSFSDGHHED
jgi:hypothetical protein